MTVHLQLVWTCCALRLELFGLYDLFLHVLQEAILLMPPFDVCNVLLFVPVSFDLVYGFVVVCCSIDVSMVHQLASVWLTNFASHYDINYFCWLIVVPPILEFF